MVDRPRRFRGSVLLAAVALVALAGCGNRLERKSVEGVDCVVVNNGVGRAQFVDCNWDEAPPPSDTKND